MTTSPALAFKQSFSPYLRRHAVRRHDLMGGAWWSTNRMLTDERIEAAILGTTILAYFATVSPRALGVDIDDHRHQGPAVLQGKYDAVRERFGGLYPSVVCRSPRGLHLWYFIPDPMPWPVLHGQAEEKLRGLGVELRPSPSNPLRIPDAEGLLDPETLLPLQRGFDEVVADAVRYHPAELFNADILPAALRSDLATRRGRYQRIRYSAVIAKAEAELAPILPGNTNDALCRLVPLYRGAGLSEEQAGLRFVGLLVPFYDGELRDHKRLRQRVRSFYRSSPQIKPRVIQHNLFTDPVADALGALVPARRRAVQVKRSVRRLVAGILDWYEFVDAIRRDPQERGLWNYLYPYFIKNTREGFTPLPRNVLRRIDPNYSRHLGFLVSSGFLSPAPYTYVPGAGVSRYYRVNLEPFTRA